MLFSTFENKEETMYQIVHYQFVVSVLIVKIAHEIDPNLQVGCMVAAEAFYSYNCNHDDMISSIEAMHDALFFTDVHVRGFYLRYALNMFERKEFKLDMT